MIGNFNNYCGAFIDWNLLLDETGGPNHVGNFCDAPIMADTKNDIVEIHSSYYCIGHFSKYLKKVQNALVQVNTLRIWKRLHLRIQTEVWLSLF
jgi:O-glycosyl hydrolase